MAGGFSEALRVGGCRAPVDETEGVWSTQSMAHFLKKQHLTSQPQGQLKWKMNITKGLWESCGTIKEVEDEHHQRSFRCDLQE